MRVHVAQTTASKRQGRLPRSRNRLYNTFFVEDTSATSMRKSFVLGVCNSGMLHNLKRLVGTVYTPTNA